MKTITNKLKVALVAVGFLAVGTVSAQSTSDVAQGANGIPTVRLIDNKGTIKYLQSNNGITQIVNTTGDRTTTTWQLGGTLTNDTFINATGQVFAITGIKNLDATANPVSDIAATSYDTTGYTIMVRDEASGEIKKMLASDLLQVQGSQHIYDAAEIVDTANPATLALTALPGAPQNLVFQKVSVYRNGAKLLAGVDYEIVNGATAANSASITLRPQVTANEDWEVFAGDKIEVHWVK